ncbi:MAG: GDYXXLXY domain-containing protein [Gloeobacterales cyanobacterium]
MFKTWISSTSADKKIPLGFFLAAVFLQTVVLLLAPARQSYILATGTMITLRTAPVDPYNILQGYYVALGYDISNPNALPGYTTQKDGQTLYVTLAKPKNSPDAPWSAVRVNTSKPPDLSPKQVVLKGILKNGRVLYGLESYNIPEEQRVEINNNLRERPERALLDAKVDASGAATPLRLRIGGKIYDY